MLAATLAGPGCISPDREYENDRHYAAEPLAASALHGSVQASAESPVDVSVEPIHDRATIRRLLGPRSIWLLRAGYVFRISVKPGAGRTDVELDDPFATLRFSEVEEYVPIRTAEIVRLASIPERWDMGNEPFFKLGGDPRDPMHPEAAKRLYRVQNEGDAAFATLFELGSKVAEASEKRESLRYANDAGADIAEKTAQPRRIDSNGREWIAVFVGAKPPSSTEVRIPRLQLRVLDGTRVTLVSFPIDLT